MATILAVQLTDVAVTSCQSIAVYKAGSHMHLLPLVHLQWVSVTKVPLVTTASATVWFELEDTYGNDVDPGVLFFGSVSATGPPHFFSIEDPNKLDSYTALELKTLVAIEDNGVSLKNVKYLELYKDNTKAHLYDDDDVMDFTGSLGGHKNHPMFFWYDIATVENGDDDDDDKDNKDESGDESSSGDDTNSDEDDSDGPNRNYTLRLQATRSCGRIRDYMAMNMGDYSYTDGALHAMPNVMAGLEYYLAEKRNRHGKVTDRGWVDRRFATLVYD
ncbi:hypothetical protein BDZ97DRAFT_299345 [Flammula alnicola]|nr:hypothetical protein BDZ97DRAFT_299345 [Flammula alnicola]